MRYCGRCWKERKGWLPDRPKPKHKKATRSKEASGSSRAGNSSRNKNKRTEGQAVKSSAGRAVPSPPPEAAEAANTSVASGSSEGPSEGPSAGSSQETLPDSGYSQSQELFSPNEEEEQRSDGKTLPPGFMDKRSRTIATSRYEIG